MSKLAKFGMGNYQYNFAADTKLYQLDISPESFEDVELGLNQVPGMDGGLPTHWQSRGMSIANDVTMRFKYRGDGTLVDLTPIKTQLNTMKRWGYSLLFKTLDDGTLVWTWAACKRVSISNDQQNLSYVWPEGNVVFQCPTARWYSKVGMQFLDDGLALDSGLTIIGPQIDRQTVIDAQIIQVTNNGDADAGCYIWWEAPAGETVTNPSLKRYSDDGVTLADEIIYTHTLNGGDVVILDARNYQVSENYSVIGDYGKVNALRGSWLQVPPGTHDFIVNGTFSNGAILSLDSWDTYY